MKDFVKRITIELEPLIADFPEKKRILESKKEELENTSRFLAYVNGDVHLVGIYANQDVIADSFDKVNMTKEEYKANCYLLESDDENVKILPQYKNAYEEIVRIIDYFKEQKSMLNIEINELIDICKRKEIEEKYYQLLSSESPYVENVEEFINFINEHHVSEEDKINLLVYIIDNNNERYKRG